MANRQTHTIGVIAGDGIGKEVIPAGMAAIEKAARGSAASDRRSPSCRGAASTTCSISGCWTRTASSGWRNSTPSTSARLARRACRTSSPPGLILAIRQRFDQYVNLRPMRLLPGSARRSPTAAPRTSTWCASARTPKASTPASAGGSTRHAARGRAADRRVHAPRHRAHPPLRASSWPRRGRARCWPARPSRTR